MQPPPPSTSPLRRLTPLRLLCLQLFEDTSAYFWDQKSPKWRCAPRREKRRPAPARPFHAP
eukprot:2235248-Prymnesium_polylepis.1